MNIDETFIISDGNGGTMQAKIISFDRRTVVFKVRKGGVGQWRKDPLAVSRHAFRKLVAQVEAVPPA